MQMDARARRWAHTRRVESAVMRCSKGSGRERKEKKKGSDSVK